MSNTQDGCFLGGQPPVDGGGSCECENHGFWAYRSANQTIGSGTNVALDYTTKRDDPSGMFSLATDYATIPVTGRYTFTAAVELVFGARGQGFLRCFRNGTSVTGTYWGSGSDETSIPGTTTPQYTVTDWFQAGETLKMYVFQNSGFAASAIGCCNQIWFGGALIYKDQ